MTIFAEHAPRYWKVGLPAIPVKPWSKAPARNGWTRQCESLPTLSEQREWLEAYPDHNIGLALGPSSGLCAVDIDTTDAAEIAAVRAALPPSPWERVGKKGVGLIYRNPHGVANFSIPGTVDFLANGRQIVVPPSIHPDTGLPYRANCSLHDLVSLTEIPSLPANVQSHMRDALARHNPHTRMTVQEGGRHNAILSKAGQLRNQGVVGDALRLELHHFNRNFSQPPLPDDEVEAIVVWAQNIPGGDGHPFTELGNSRRLVAALGRKALYVSKAKSWYVWNGSVWGPDTNGQIERAAKSVADSLLDNAGPEKEARAGPLRAQSARSIRAMIDLAKTEPDVLFDATNFDAQTDTINTPTGVVNLRDGGLCAASPEDYHSKTTGVPYDPSAECPRFYEFLTGVFADEPTRAFVQRVAGYCLTGRTDEQKFFIASGGGANGKSVLVNALAACFGDYAKHTPMSTFMQRRSEAATNDLAALNGARFVIANEGNRGQTLDTALVKSMTGGDPISARFLYQDYVTFTPRFKPFIVSNHLPEIDANDPAIWRRLIIIPFSRVFREEEQDSRLPEKLRDEMPGILRWAVEESVSYFKLGLAPSAAVQLAASSYRVEMDIVGSFISDCCTAERSSECPATQLYFRYSAYARDAGAEVMSQTAFGRELGRRNFMTIKKAGVIWRRGLALRPHCTSPSN